MRSFWRVLLVWLTALAIPVQGIAAAGMTHCVGSAVPVHQHVQQDHHAMSGADHAGPHAHPAATAADELPAGVASLEEAPETSSHPGKAPGVDKKCSACAACCAAAALPSYVAQVPMLDLASTPVGLLEATSVSFIASGPERPPRQHLA